ncbi:hypothetical protein M2103_000842 [Ereboglobus sp. PH5-5]|uniref:hypothetical protein n=1 Tax=Ereboglobus sp. PH5-5 TaxID=2940529 RepID=UPI002404BC30|nr:hypothetical protein [Ereboglobus sp. PH5-5]MDF9832632.1 hypothetical protein [Ereboglobus sp. PH5-5]
MFNKTEYLKFLKEFKTFTTKIDGPENGFAWDGPISIDSWKTMSPKIVFLAKETYGYLGCDCCPVIGDPDGWDASKFNHNIAKLAYGLFYFSNTGTAIKQFPPLRSIANELRDAYSKIAQIEIKKTSTDGSTKRSDDRVIREHSVRNAAYLARQLKMLYPDIVFCCGGVTYDSLVLDMKVFTPKHRGSEVELIDGTIVVNSYHPSASQFNINHIYGKIIKVLKKRV